MGLTLERKERPGWKAGALLSCLSCTSLALALAGTVLWRGEAAMGGLGGDGYDYIEAARHLTGESRHPPGLPLLLAPFSGSVGAMQAVTLGIALGLMGAIWWAAVKLGGWRSGIAAGVLMLASPALTEGGAAIMSDRLGALLIVGALLAIMHNRPIVAGVLGGLGGWVRLVHVLLLAALPRRAWAAAVGVCVALVVWQLTVKGSLLGYRGSEEYYSLGNLTGTVQLEEIAVLSPHTNIGYFPTRMFGLESMVAGGLHLEYLAPFLIFPAAIGLRRHWGPAARFTMLTAAINIAMYLPFWAQSSRYVLPGGCLLIVFAAASVGRARPDVRPRPPRLDVELGVVRGDASV